MNDQPGWQVEQLLDTFHTTPISAMTPNNAPRSTRAIQDVMRSVQAAQDAMRQLTEIMKHLLDTRAHNAPATDSGSKVSVGHAHAQPDDAASLPGSPPPDTFGDAHAMPVGGPSQNHEQSLRSREQHLTSAARQLVQQLQVYQTWLVSLLPEPCAARHTNASGHALVSAFNSAAIQVVLLAAQPGFLEEQAQTGALPRWLEQSRYRASMPVVLAELSFRSMPEAPRSGGVVHRGRATITMTSYALRQDELDLLRHTFDEARFLSFARQLGFRNDEELRLVCLALQETDTPALSPNVEPADDTNPFSVLWLGLRDLLGFNKGDSILGGGRADRLPKDKGPEQVIRSAAVVAARSALQELYLRFRATLDAGPRASLP
jgi:hypothetical protein